MLTPRVLAPVILLALLTGCTTVDGVLDAVGRPSARLVDIGLADVNLSSALLDLRVEITNPYSVPLPLVNLDYSLASQGATFLAGEAVLQGAVPARGTQVVTVPVLLTFQSLLDAVSDVRPGAIVPYAADLGLSVDAPGLGDLRFPLRKEGEVPVPAAPEVDLADVTWDELNLQHASGKIRLGLVNHNQFPVDIRSLDYTFMLAGAEVAHSSLSRAASFPAGGGRAELEIPVSISTTEIGAGVLRMLMGTAADYDLTGDFVLETPFGPMNLPALASGRTKLYRR